MTVSAESEAIEAELPQLPLKSRCLRQSSVAKRLRLETSKGAERAKTRGIKKRLSRYRRKTENAKERERMKKFNEAFENLRQKLPNRDLLSEKSVAGEKDTKVRFIFLRGLVRMNKHFRHSNQDLPIFVNASNSC